MRRTRMALLLVLPLALAACQPPEEEAEPETTPATMADVDQLRARWVELAAAGDVAGVAGLYAPDAVMLISDEVMTGPQEIQQALSFEGMTDIQINPEHTELGQDLASDWGTFSQTYQTPDGGEEVVAGPYLVVARRQADGSWKIVQHLAVMPQAPPPAAPDADTM